MRVTHAAGCFLLVLASSCGGGEASQPAPAIGSAPSQQAATPPAPPAPSTTPDADAVEAARPSLRACYDKARNANPALGRTTVTFTLRVESGHVSSVNIDYKQKFDEAAKTCLRDASLAIPFPPGDARKVEIPVTFEAK